MQLRRTTSTRSLISLVSMIDVLMIMLIFFMVTSTYLDLNMLPLSEPADPTTTQQSDQTSPSGPNDGSFFIRLASSGEAYIGGTARSPAELTAMFAETPGAAVAILPSRQAATQDLVSLMDLTIAAGISEIRLVRLDPRP